VTKNKSDRRPESPAPTDEAPVARDERSAVASFPIVGVGASAGGLEAFTQLLKALPLDTGMGFVLVQHLDPEHESALTQILSRATSLPVCDVTNNQPVQPNHVYIIPPDTNLSIVAGILKLQPRPKTRTPHRPIDSFFESLAQDQHERAIGVVLSGTASDGTLGLEAIKVEGGITFAQDDSAKYDSMPRSAVAAGCVDLVLSPTDIALELARIAKHPYVAGQPLELSARAPEDLEEATAHQDNDSPLPTGGNGSPRTGAAPARAERGRGKGTESQAAKGADDGYAKTLSLLRNHSGVDFSLYKSSTIERRVARRLVISKQNTLEDYAKFLGGNVKELDALCTDVLISVTSFFRNPEAFDALQRDVLPELLKQPGDEPIRVWVPGCSTGQEAYSIAIAFMESAEKAPRGRNLQVFATDLNEKLLDKARFGLYPKSLSEDISPERLRRFFVEEQGGYRVSKSLREMVVFAKQNLFADPPFSRMDLISCRNLLIYLGPTLQKKAIPTFHYALKPGGFLLLGASESVSGYTELFEPVDRKYKIYSKKAAPTPAFHLPASREHGERASSARRAPALPVGQPHPTDGFNNELSAQREADRVTVNQFAPPGVLVNADLQVLQFRGSTGAFLEPPVGKASFNVLKMAREGLMLPLRAAINEAKKENKTTRRDNVRVKQNGEDRAVHLEIIPLKNLPEPCFLILFEEAEKADRAPLREQPAKPPISKQEETNRIAELETDLSETREYLQTIQEQHEATNEELQASSEEVQSANEELQSINEELETSKEELESSNEELSTVNEEMTHRNSELNVLNNDLVNFQNSTRLVVLLLGRDLTIRRFSPQAEKQFELLPTDLGRPLSHLRHNLVLADDAKTPLDLEALCVEVITSVQEQEREVRDKAGHWHSLRVRPYTTLDHKIDGAVLLLLEIDELKQSEQAVAVARDYAENMVDTVREPLLVLDSDLRIDSANRAFYRAFRVEPAETVGTFIYNLGNHQWDIPRLRELLEEILMQSTSIEEFQVEHDFEQLGHRIMLLNARRILDPQRKTERILLAIEDITARKRAEAALLEAGALQRAIFNSANFSSIATDEKGVIQIFNVGAERMLGYTAAEVMNKLTPADLSDPQELIARATALSTEFATTITPGFEALVFKAARGIEDVYELTKVRKDGSRFPAIVSVTALRDPQDAIIGYLLIGTDNTARSLVEAERTRLEIQKQEQAAELSDLHRRKDEFLAMLSHELRSPLAPIANAVELLGLQKGSETLIQQQARGIIQRQMGHLQHLVDDLLEVSRITTGRVQLRRVPVTVSTIVEGAVETARPLIEKRRHELTVSLPPEPIWLQADTARMEQVLVNLLTNAAKYTPEGGHVTLTVELVSGTALAAGSSSGNIAATTPAASAVPLTRPADECIIRICDTGVGISPELLPHVFDLFTQAERSLDRSQGGLGIGLALVHRLTELHGGTVEAHSTLGQGSEFVVHLPVMSDEAHVSGKALAAGSSLAPRPSPLAPHLKVLVVDDNVDTVLSFSMLLKASGHDVRNAHDGPTAVQVALDYQPDVVLLDIGLPGLNGYQVAKRIRQEPNLKNVVLVALTGYGQEADRQTALEAGFNHHLVKPARLEQLQKILATVSEKVT
jgi:two-component system CheB/CheR fusion protein